MKLKKVTIHKYKSFYTDQTFDVEDDITILVGVNESGKSAILEAIAKARDKELDFNKYDDYPKSQLKNYNKNKKAVTLQFEMTQDIINQINKEFKVNVFYNNRINFEAYYDNTRKIRFEGLRITDTLFENILGTEIWKSLKYNIKTKIINAKNFGELKKIPLNQNILNKLSKYYNNEDEGSLVGYIYKKFVKDHLPKVIFLYNYIDKNLDDSIILEKLNLDINAIKNADDPLFELEMIESDLTNTLLKKYWKTNDNLKLKLRINPKDSNKIFLRIEEINNNISLPLYLHSLGFKWFFNFYVWLMNINDNSIILLDEPGLHLHASAQKDLLDVLENFSQKYQIIYTTHSPFMIPPDKLHRIRVVELTDQGSVINNIIQKKDPRSLFPLQAALGYDIAQNLFISKRNLLVEGVSDMVYLEVMSSILKEAGREGLDDNITIVPTGGLDKVATFISLMRGNKLEIVCLLDTPAKGSKQKLDNLIKQKLIRDKAVKFFHDFVGYQPADIEDLFAIEDYVELFNKGFEKAKDKLSINVNDLTKGQSIIRQINGLIGKDRFNHYLPAKALSAGGYKADDFAAETLDNFERVFKTINQLFN